jgi:hypothetical protein
LSGSRRIAAGGKKLRHFPAEAADLIVSATEERRYYRYFALAKGLVDYRARLHGEAVDWLNRFAPRADGTHCDGSGFATLAMAHHRLGRADDARASLAAARAIVAKQPQDAMRGWGWRDWLHCELLIREAEQILKN